MASLGVLSKTHREGAIKLLGKSLGMELHERKIEVDKDAFIKELQSLAKAEKDKQIELQAHIKEMEDMGYDMTEYKESLNEQIGGATKEEVEEAKKEALHEIGPVQIDTTQEEFAKNVPEAYKADTSKASEYAHVMRTCGEVDGQGPRCNRDCQHCTRTHCPYRREKC